MIMTRIARSVARAVRAVLCAIIAAPLAAQDAPLVTRTIPLHHLRAADAARLISPYVTATKGAVYEAGAVRAVTVTETAATLARIDSIVRQNDLSPAVLVFRFQLIAADDTPGRDPAIDSLDAMLRGLFRYKGYHLLGQGTATAAEAEPFSLTIAAGEDRFALFGEVVTVQTAPARSANRGDQPLLIVDGALVSDAGRDVGSVRVRVRLARAAGATYQGKPAEAETLLATGLTVPLGQTVVLGSAAPGGRNQALILVVRPDIAIPSRP
jgi:hypothetical protein